MEDANKPDYKIRVELCPRKINPRFFQRRIKTRFTQGEPYELYFRLTNIGSSPTPEFTISNFSMHSKSDNVTLDSPNSLLIKPLNPNEKIEVELDKMTIGFKGGAWVSVNIQATDQANKIHTFQYDSLHNKDAFYEKDESWGNLIYVQGELEIAQQKTNLLILILTLVTVIEAVFGMKKTLVAIAEAAYYPISQLAKFLEFLVK
ncbi:hypothetical protein J1G34_06145 [Pseudomonas sp. Wu6]|uniref:hypothetical protein n=1 Tax=Pseudomonas sp. Wu6 TaxID=1210129 RepID=UPI001CA6B681|nr:hypothetical protein [Pseudomonas sp. Wu6]MBY8928618.1 hypothetical protein [Pseudomonas sp. Wu6]